MDGLENQEGRLAYTLIIISLHDIDGTYTWPTNSQTHL
jgi:hypothetical protein